jgi:hypothetical protein
MTVFSCQNSLVVNATGAYVKSDIEPFQTFLNTYSKRPDLSARAIDVIRPLVDRLAKSHWPLVPSCEINPAEVMRILNLVFLRKAAAVELRSLAACRTIDTELEPFQPEIEPSIERALESKLSPVMNDCLDLAFSQTFDLNSDDPETGGALVQKLKNLPFAAAEAGLSISYALALGCVLAASVDDEKSLDLLEPAARLGLRLMLLGFRKDAPDTLVVLSA